MTDSRPTTIRPEVADFVAAVRAHLADLDEEVREELVGGLEADLSEELDEGSDALPDPGQYAAELRAAAGLPEPRRTGRRPGPALPSAASVESWLDDARGTWLRLVASEPWARQGWDVATTLRPVWWVLRAWVAVKLIDQLASRPEPAAVVPSLAGDGLGILVLGAAVVGSVLLGLGRTGRLGLRGGPGSPLGGRLALLALNLFALSMVPSAASWVENGQPDYFYYDSAQPVVQRQGLVSDGRAVRNVFAYDAAGQPITGVQLFDQDGDPLDVTARAATQGRGDERSVGCPAYDATGALFNVFPLAERSQRRGTCLDDVPDVGVATAPIPPLVSVLPVTSPVAGADPAGDPAVDPAAQPTAAAVP